MKLRVQKNINSNTDEIVYGISIKVDGSRYYCKYPISHQEYKTKKEATEIMNKIKDILNNGGEIEYAPSGYAGINEPEYVLIKEGVENIEHVYIEKKVKYFLK